MSEVKNIMDTTLPEYNGTDEARIAVYNVDTEELNWSTPGGGGSGGSGGTKKLTYGAIMLATGGDTSETQSDIRSGITRDFGYCLTNPGDPGSGLSPEYQKVLVDIFDGQEKKCSGLSFASFPAMYTWLQDSANGISFSGGKYDNNVKAVFYDEIDFSIDPLTKIYGKNMFYSVLKGKANGYGIYKSGGSSDNRSTIYNTNWSNIDSWVEDVFANTNTIAGYTYPGTSVLRCFTTPSKFKSAMNGLHSLTTQLENRSNKSHINDSTETITNGGINVYNVDFGDSVFYSRDIDNVNSWQQLNSLAELNTSLLNTNNSVVRVYKLYSGNEYQFYIKPIGVDTLYVDYYDQTKYDLVRVTIGRDQYMNLKTITPGDGHEGRNILQIPKSEWVDSNLQTQGRGRNSIKIAKEYKFVLRDKVTKRISLPTENSIMFRVAGRGAPVDIRVE